jgi:putative copper export protein
VSEPVSLLDAAYGAARWGWYLAAFLVLGAGSYAPFFFPGPRSLPHTDAAVAGEVTRRAARIGLSAGVALICFTLLRFYLQARGLNEPGEPLTLDFLRAVLGSRWGHGWRLQALAAVLVTVMFALARPGARIPWTLALLCSLGVGATAGMTGHAGTAKSGAGGLLIDVAHVTLGGWWLGGLGVMVLAGLTAARSAGPERRPAVLQSLVGDFSRRAQVAAPLAIAFGIWLAARYLGWTWPLHVAGSYRWVLVGKLAVLASVAALGAFNWRVTQPRLTQPGGEPRLRRFSALELWLGIVLLGVTAVLVSLPLPEGM